MSQPGTSTEDALRALIAAFNRHDLDAVMAYFAEDCVLFMRKGVAPRGDRYNGKAAVRAALATRFEGLPDAHYGEAAHWACGPDFGVSEWTLTGTRPSGEHVAVRGVDLLEFRDGAIVRKDSFWKLFDGD